METEKNSRDVVLIPAFRRPEFLVYTLALIRANPGWEDFQYVFALDHGYSHTMIDVIEAAEIPHSKIFETPATRFKLGKQSFNLLYGYRMAESLAKEFVFMIEEDVFVSGDFFRWHYAVHEQEPDIFCSIGTANNNTHVETTGDPGTYYLIRNDYQSLGVGFRKETVAYFLKETRYDYFSDPIGYCADKFPDSNVNRFHVEQDGLIRRIIERDGAQVAFPHRPRGYHAGFYGMHRAPRVDVGALSFTEQMEYVKETAFSPDQMRVSVQHPSFYEDSQPVDLRVRSWEKQELDGVFR